MANDAPEQLVEQIPGKAGGVSALASAAAPYIYFDGVGAFGVNDAVVHVTLEALRYHVTVPGRPVLIDRVQAAHLRMTPTGARNLIEALTRALDLSAPPKSPQEVN